MDYPHFTNEELACRCCGVNAMKPEFMDRLEILRGVARFPFVITSGYRCPKHNDAVSSTGRSGPHTSGQAVDIAVSGNKALRLIALAVEAGFTGVGVKQHGSSRFVHVDDLPAAEGRPRPWIWSYR